MKYIYTILVVVFTLLFTACSDKQEKNTQSVLKVGMELAYPPFEMSDKNGKPTGVSVDLAYALGQYLNRKVIIENIAWDDLIPSLKTKKIDIIISSMTITHERKKTIAFSDGYAKTSLAILANKNSSISGIKDLNQKSKIVAVKASSTGHIYTKEHLKNAHTMVFAKESDCVLAVVQGKADGFIYDQLSIYNNWSKHINTTKPLLQSFQDDSEQWGIALRKDEPELQKSLNTFIKQAKKDGTFDAISYKYLRKVRETFDILNIPFFF